MRLTRLFAVMLVLFVATVKCVCSQISPDATKETVFYVSPAGNDGFPGTLKKPFKSLDRARDAVRSLRHTHGGLPAPVTILLRGGTYWLSAPFLLQPEDGGTMQCPVTYAAYPGETPVLSGGTAVGGWHSNVINGRNVWTAGIGKVTPEGGRLRQLWVNDTRRPQSRFPNRGYLHVASAPEVQPQTAWNEGQWSFKFQAEAIPKWRSLNGSECILMNRWTESHLPVTGWSHDSSTIRFGLRTVFRTEPDDPYYLLNVPEALDTAGEWLWDSGNALLHYLPKPDEHPGKITAVIPRLSRLLVIEGGPGSGGYVEHLIFRGITFSHTEWGIDGTSEGNLLSLRSGGFGQAAVGLPAAIEAEGLRHSLFEECRVAHAGTYALSLRKGSRFVTVSRCTFTDLGGGGIKVGETEIPNDTASYTSHNTIVDCTIANAGLVFHSAVGIWVGQSPANRIIHNHIYDLYYSGISLGWTWGYGPSITGNTLVALNHIHHIGVRIDGDGRILADMGGIYTVGARWQTMIRRNFFHDIGARLYGGWGIYYDEGTTGAISEQNIICRTSHEGFHQHYGRENVFRNNIIAYSREYQVRISRAEPHTSFAFERNIVTWDGGPMFAERDSGTIGLFDHNLYWFVGGKPLMMDTVTFAGWQARGRDMHSIVADPLLGDTRNDEFLLRVNSPAHKLGIVQPDISRARDPSPLTPRELAELSRPLPPGRLLYNNDGSNIVMSCDSLTRDRAYERIDPLAGTGVSTFIHNVNPGQNMGYPSAVAPMFHWERPVNKPAESWDIYGTRMDHNLRSLVRDSIDPVGMVMERAWFRGMGAFLSFRMNELHDVDKPGSPLLGPFWKSHPEYRVGGYPGWGAYALNYAIPEVREYFFAILREVCERYDCDGLELDFMRFPYYFPPHRDSIKTYASVMTEFVRRVRAMTAEIAGHRGRPMLLSARVPTSLAACAYVGLDPAAWANDGLIDLLTIAPFLSTQPEIPVAEFRQACSGIPVYAGLEYTMGTRSMLREQKRAAAALLYAAGADGIYLFNYFVYWDAGLKADMDVLTELADPVLLSHTDKLYTVAPTRHPIPMVTPASPMPLVVPRMETRTISFRTAERQTPKSVAIRIECSSDIGPEELKVWFNVKEQGRGVHPADLLPFPQTVDFTPAPAARVLEFQVDPSLLGSENSLTILATRDVQVDYVYVAVKQGG
jgi:hypothetical protein